MQFIPVGSLCEQFLRHHVSVTPDLVLLNHLAKVNYLLKKEAIIY